MSSSKTIDKFEFETRVLDKIVEELMKTDEGAEFLEDIMEEVIMELKTELRRNDVDFIDGIYNVQKYYQN